MGRRALKDLFSRRGICAPVAPSDVPSTPESPGTVSIDYPASGSTFSPGLKQLIFPWRDSDASAIEWGAASAGSRGAEQSAVGRDTETPDLRLWFTNSKNQVINQRRQANWDREWRPVVSQLWANGQKVMGHPESARVRGSTARWPSSTWTGATVADRPRNRDRTHRGRKYVPGAASGPGYVGPNSLGNRTRRANRRTPRAGPTAERRMRFRILSRRT